MDNLDRSYRIVKRSSGLFLFSILYLWIVKPVLTGTAFEVLNDFLVAIPILVAGTMSIVGFVYAMRGSQYGKRNPRKRFFALFGNFMFSLIIVALFVAIIYDISIIFGT